MAGVLRLSTARKRRAVELEDDGDVLTLEMLDLGEVTLAQKAALLRVADAGRDITKLSEAQLEDLSRDLRKCVGFILPTLGEKVARLSDDQLFEVVAAFSTARAAEPAPGAQTKEPAPAS